MSNVLKICSALANYRVVRGNGSILFACIWTVRIDIGPEHHRKAIFTFKSGVTEVLTQFMAQYHSAIAYLCGTADGTVYTVKLC